MYVKCGLVFCVCLCDYIVSLWVNYMSILGNLCVRAMCLSCEVCVFFVLRGSVCVLGHCACECLFLGNHGWFIFDILPPSDGECVFLWAPCA